MILVYLALMWPDNNYSQQTEYCLWYRKFHTRRFSYGLIIIYGKPILTLPLVTSPNLEVPPQPCHQQATSSVHYTTSCKHSLVLPRMGKIIARNILSWLKLLINCYCWQWPTEEGGFWVFKPTPPKFWRPYKNRAKLNPIVKTVKKNCWI